MVGQGSAGRGRAGRGRAGAGVGLGKGAARGRALAQGAVGIGRVVDHLEEADLGHPAVLWPARAWSVDRRPTRAHGFQDSQDRKQGTRPNANPSYEARLPPARAHTQMRRRAGALPTLRQQVQAKRGTIADRRGHKDPRMPS